MRARVTSALALASMILTGCFDGDVDGGLDSGAVDTCPMTPTAASCEALRDAWAAFYETASVCSTGDDCVLYGAGLPTCDCDGLLGASAVGAPAINASALGRARIEVPLDCVEACDRAGHWFAGGLCDGWYERPTCGARGRCVAQTADDGCLPSPDAGPGDAGPFDGGPTDGSVPDGSVPDGSISDGSIPDGG